jgi:non-heme chloroperoxidase
MATITTKDGVGIFYKDWGSGQPIVFSHGWPLSADDWDPQMMFFLNNGFRVIAHDRRGHGRSSQVDDGHDMDHYAHDLAALTAHLDLKNAIHVGHSTGGGEVAHYIARHGEDRVAKAALISAVPPLMVKTESNPDGLPKSGFDDYQAQLAANRAQFYYDVPVGPFYGYNRPGVKAQPGVITNWWRQGMMGGRQGALRRHRCLLADESNQRRIACELIIELKGDVMEASLIGSPRKPSIVAWGHAPRYAVATPAHKWRRPKPTP